MELEQKKKSIMFYELCRLCLDEHGHCDIFEKDGLTEDIYRCIGVKMTLSDNLPQRICKNCLDIVEKATKLSVIATKNERHLKTLFCDVEEEASKKTTQELMEIVNSTHFEKNNSSSEKNSAIENFISVRMDLFESSVAESSIMPKKGNDNLPDSSQKKEKPRSDDGNFDYTCSVCSKKFDKYRKMYHHTRLHKKNYACPIDVCGKKFATKGDMAKHIRTHTGEKPYRCDLCDKSFAQRVTLRSHKETVHNGP